MNRGNWELGNIFIGRRLTALVVAGLSCAVTPTSVDAAEKPSFGQGPSTNVARLAGKLIRHDTRVLVIGDSTFAEANDNIGFWSAALHQWRPRHWRGFGFGNPSIQNGYNGVCGYNRTNAPGSGAWTAIYPGESVHHVTGAMAFDFVSGRLNHDLGHQPITDLFGIGLNRLSLLENTPFGRICADAEETSGLGRPGTTLRIETDLYHLDQPEWLDGFSGHVTNFDGQRTPTSLSDAANSSGQTIGGYHRITIGDTIATGTASKTGSNAMLRVAGPGGFGAALPEGANRFVRESTRVERTDIRTGLFMHSIARGGWTINFHAKDPRERGASWWPSLDRGSGPFLRGYADAALDRTIKANRIDTFVVSLGINDAKNGRSGQQMMADFEVLLRRIIDAHHRVWDTEDQPYILILAPWHLRDSSFDPNIAAEMALFEQALRRRCRGRIGLISLEAIHQGRFGDLATGSPATTDLVHPNKFGANVIMKDVWDHLVDQAPPPSDIDLDGEVDSTDFGLVLQDWGLDGGPADLDDNGVVDAGDLGMIFMEWGRWLP